MKVLDFSHVARQLHDAGIPHCEELAKLAAPSVPILRKLTYLPKIARGQSRFGGWPDLPEDFAWPERGGRPLAFLAQLDLSEIDAPDLPPAGWLLFFYDRNEQPWGFDPEHAGGARVIFVDVDRAALSNRFHPMWTRDEDEASHTCSLEFGSAVELPCLGDSLLEQPELVGEAHWDAYEEVRNKLSGITDQTMYQHLLGHPQMVQGDMRTMCELVTEGLNCSDTDDMESERAQQLLARSPDEWQLLLQLDTERDDDLIHWKWGDWGRLYFWIRRSDLAARAFDKTWLVLQSR